MSSIIYSETPVKEIWSRLAYFENEHNAKEFLKDKNKSLTEEQLTDIAQRLSFSMQSAKEYYQSASSVSLLTKPLLLFYGMVALSKALFISIYVRKSPSKGHGLESPNDDFQDDFCNISTKVKKDGTFPQFHCCFAKQTLYNMSFTLNELLANIAEIKSEYETVFGHKANTVSLQKSTFGYLLVDNDGFGDYSNLKDTLSDLKVGKYFGIDQYQGKTISILSARKNLPRVRALSGKEFLMLSLKKNNILLYLPELSAHYLAMYLLGMASRYYPKEWGEITEGKKSGDIYVIRKFIEITERKFPNLILNSLRNMEFVFVSPTLEEVQRLSDTELERVYRYVEDKENQKARGAGLF